MTSELLDTTYTVETPEAIDLNAQLAGPIPRTLAFSIDFLFRILILIVLSIILSFAGLSGTGILLIIIFFIEWFYPVVFEVLKNGQTPGKRRMHIAVVNDDLTPINWSNSIIRNLLRFVDFLPSFYLFGFTAICCSNNFQRLGDMAAGTLVIHRPKTPEKINLPDVSVQAPPFSLSSNDQVALVSYVQRHEQLSQARKEELANILEELTQKTDKTAVRFIQGIGRWLLGDKDSE